MSFRDGRRLEGYMQGRNADFSLAGDPGQWRVKIGGVDVPLPQSEEYRSGRFATTREFEQLVVLRHQIARAIAEFDVVLNLDEKELAALTGWIGSNSSSL